MQQRRRTGNFGLFSLLFLARVVPPTMSRIDTLKIYVEVVSSKNFTTAGKLLGLTPSAISKHIGMLEQRLGVRLLNRTTRAVSTTEAGQLYFERCRHIIDALDEAEALVTDMDSTPRGTLKLAAEPVFGRAILARIIADYSAAYPQVNAELFLSDHSLDLVKQGFDAGIHLGKLEDPTLATMTFADHSVILCASSDYIADHGAPKLLTELAQHRLIKIASIELHQPRQLEDYYTNLNIQGGVHLTVNDTDMAYHAAMAGIGIAPLPNYLVMPQIQRGRLVQVLPDTATKTMPVQLVFPINRHISSKTSSFIDFLRDYFPAFRQRQQASAGVKKMS